MLNIPLIMVGTGAGFIIGGPVGAAIGAAAGGFIGKKPDYPAGTVIVPTSAGPVAVAPDTGIPPAVQAGANLINQLVTTPGIAPYMPVDLPFIPGAL